MQPSRRAKTKSAPPRRPSSARKAS
jgi:hypothetical protein